MIASGSDKGSVGSRLGPLRVNKNLTNQHQRKELKPKIDETHRPLIGLQKVAVTTQCDTDSLNHASVISKPGLKNST